MMAFVAAGCGSGGRLESFRGADAASVREVDRVVERVKPALVRIHVVSTDSRDGREVKGEGAGSGVIVTPEGHVVTNHHVAARAVRAWVTMHNREVFEAELVGTDPMSDIAVMQIRPDKPMTFAYAEWGDSTRVRVGDTVFAMGSPLTLSQSVTRGIVSNTEMVMPSVFGRRRFELDGEDVGSIVRWLGHDAEIFRGNSGGPLVDTQGRVIGINEISYGLGGAIPSALARPVAEELMRRGEIERAHVGLLLQPLPKKFHHRPGVLIATVLDGSPAAEAGIRSGDFLVGIGEAPVAARFYEEIPPINIQMASLAIGRPVAFRLHRGDEERVVELVPQSRERVLHPEVEFRDWGITGRKLSSWTMLSMSRENTEGVLVTSVRPGGPAGSARPEIQSDDILVKVGDRDIRTLKDLREATETLLEGHDDPVPTLATFDRRNQRYLTVVEVGVKDLDDPGAEVPKAWVPVLTQVLTRRLAEALDMADTPGVRVVQVFGSGDGKDAPFEVGDLILTLDGDRIQASEPHHSEVFAELVRQYRIGTEVEFGIARDGEPMTIAMALAARPKQPREMKRYRNLDFDLIVRELAYMDEQRAGFSHEESPRVVVDSVTDGGWAALGRLRVGDLLLAIDGQPVASIEDVESMLEGIAERRDRYVIFKVRRDTQNVFLEVEPLWRDIGDGGGGGADAEL